ncbi:MAG TPA: hypothetical protein VEM14_10420, partial [Gemmatimonadaceae bacterium]|nr:hypothetical protein [Gemmatimonadaceae bacterium]
YPDVGLWRRAAARARPCPVSKWRGALAPTGGPCDIRGLAVRSGDRVPRRTGIPFRWKPFSYFGLHQTHIKHPVQRPTTVTGSDTHHLAG